MTLGIELEREDDGRWLAEVPTLAGVMCYGQTREDAVARVQALALRVIADLEAAPATHVGRKDNRSSAGSVSPCSPPAGPMVRKSVAFGSLSPAAPRWT